MKELILSTVERDFILKAIGERKRLDGRQAYDARRMNIQFGVDSGCCVVDLGDTKVMAQVSCEITEPKDSRPNEGILLLNIELSPMAAPHYEAGRRNDDALELQRLLEHCLWESRCIDAESLCITSGLRVWTIRVDVHVLNYDGNVIDAASVAAIAALLHFRRPDVSVCGEEIIIHSPSERDPLPLSVIHIPVCVTFAFFDDGKFMLVDPTQREQLVADGMVTVAMNKHREICMLETSGTVLLVLDQVTRCTDIAAVKVAEVTELIHTALDNQRVADKSDTSDMTSAATVQLSHSQAVDSGLVADKTDTSDITSAATVPLSRSQAVDLEAAKQTAATVLNTTASDDEGSSSSDVYIVSEPAAANIDAGVSVIGEGGASAWSLVEAEMDDDIELIETAATASDSVHSTLQQSAITVDSDSEEETVLLLESVPGKLTKPAEPSVPGKASDKCINLKKAVRRRHHKMQ